MSLVFKLGYKDGNWIDKAAGKTVYSAGTPAVAPGTGIKGVAAYYSPTAMNNGGYLYLADSLDFSFGANNFTINTWIKRVGTLIQPQLFCYGTEADPYLEAWFTYAGKFTIYVYDYAGGANKYWQVVWALSGSAYNNRAWNHIEVSRTSGTFILFINGVLVASPTVTSSGFTAGFSIPEISASWHIGNRINWKGESSFNAGQLIEDFSIYKGECLHTVGFNPSYPGLLPGFQVL
jgi:hypothetical protein